MSISKRRLTTPADSLTPVAGNGLLDRRALLGRGIMFAGAAATGVGASGNRRRRRAAQGRPVEPRDGRRRRRRGRSRRGSRSTSCACSSNPNNEPRNSHARTPHHLLKGTITPSALHFTINHSGMPDIDPAKHRLVIHGMVKQPKVFSLDDLDRYPMVTRMGVRRVRRQLRADVLQRADAGDRAGAARARLQLGMDRRAALDPAR